MDWKLANAVPMLKKRKKKGPGNYTSVNLTSVPGKILEKIILEGIEVHLGNNEVIGPRQCGFMRDRSC